MNVLNGCPGCAIGSSNQWATPNSLQEVAKAHLHDLWQAETCAEAERAFDFFVKTYGVKRGKAVAKLIRDRGRC